MSGHDEALDRIAATLTAFGVRFVVVGGYALDVQDYDIGYRTDDIDMAIQATADNFDVSTSYSPDMTYDDFAPNSHPVTIVVDGDHHTIQAADVHDIMRSKRAANRAKDRPALDLLETQLRRRGRD